LNILDPDLKQGTLRVMGKGSTERVVPVGKKALIWLKRYLKQVHPQFCRSPDEQALWISKNTGKRLSYARVDKLIREYAKDAGLGVLSTHGIRRACATHMLQNGAHPVEIQLLLGHGGLKHLGQYLRVTVTEMKTMHQRSKPGR
jgi:integrase/recombinase XerD